MRPCEHCSLCLMLHSLATIALSASAHTSNGDSPRRSWLDQHPQQRFYEYAARLPCYSCMSPYLEHQYKYISHLYRRPLSFTAYCDQSKFDGRHMKWKNCTDMCIILRMNDRLGGQSHEGYLRGCVSDIIHYNHSVTRIGSSSFCAIVRMRDLFMSKDRNQFEAADYVQLCACHSGLCNSALSKISIHFLVFLISFTVVFLSL